MATSARSKLRLILLSGVAAAALAAGPQLLSSLADAPQFDGRAYAQSHGQGGQGRGQGRGGSGYRGGKAPGDPSGHGDGEEGHGSEGHSGGSSSHSGGSHGEGTTHGGDSHSGGSHTGGMMGEHGSRQPGSSGGRPAWAQEGIPEVELGRLNVIRSPNHVIDRALTETVSTFPAAAAPLYSGTAEQFANVVKANWDTVTIIDSPLQNLGLFKDLLRQGQTQLPGVRPASKVDLAAIFLGTASDKTIPISTNTVIAVTKIMGVTLTDAEITSLAVKAETVRQAILEGHG